MALRSPGRLPWEVITKVALTGGAGIAVGGVVVTRLDWRWACLGLAVAVTVEGCEPLRYGKGVPKISSKHQVTLPVATLKRAGLKAGDEVAIEAEGSDRIVVSRVVRDPRHALGVFDGLYEPDYLQRLRAGERA